MSLAKIGVRAARRRVLLYGVGNFMFPHSRYSVGNAVVGRLGKQLKLRWDDDLEAVSVLAESQKYLLAKPKNYLINETGRALAATLKKTGFSLNDVVVIHYENDLELGNMQLKMEGRTTHNTALESIFKHFRTEQFARLAIGVGHPSWKATQGDHLMNHGYENSFYRDMFLGNKFPAEEQLVFDKIIYPNATKMLENYLGGKGVADLSSFTYYNAVELAKRMQSEDDVLARTKNNHEHEAKVTV